MAALSVVGHCRERSPADLALFGPDADRLVERFVDPRQGQALLARAIGDGAVEGEADLLTPAGPTRFQISLWRQRGGERVRIVAAFAELADAPPLPPQADPAARRPPAEEAPSRALSGAFERLARDLRAPLGALMSFANQLRAADPPLPAGLAAEARGIIAAAWRIMRLADDVALTARLGAERPPLRLSEVDIARLTRRILRLAEPAAVAAGVAFELGGLQDAEAGPAVLADESLLWSAIDALLRAAVAAAPPGGRIALGLEPAGALGGLALVLAPAEGGAIEAAGEIEAAGAMLGETGAALLRSAGALRIVFPAERCLGPG